MSSRASTRVAVLKGGRSAEREVSLVSGAACAEALRAAGYAVEEIDAGDDLDARLSEAAPDVAFNALHGRWGEDGCVQGLLEWRRIPYTHSGVLASALAMDKLRARQVFAAAGLPVAPGRALSRAELGDAHPMEPPYVVKPVAEGSSVGILIVQEGDPPPPPPGPDMPERLMVEAFVPGRELTVAVLGEADGPRALTVTDIVPRAGAWYDYAAKYAPGGSEHVVPAQIPDAVFAACLDIAARAHAALGCRGLSRADLRWDERRGLEGLALLEVNTQPGMTPTSLAPEQAAACGISFEALNAWLVEDASCDR
ncbi:D-alanine--D-alanine ligase [Oceanicella actignis]|uniref:D-alanine--D-alanine ligase n=1 Tax=Oceanicella actignis TaxID=1189325 RepID=UPI0011E803B5|nr:D-alanine--D-alanine ligase [Oceanicella actignis]TYO91536.1 D-alanine-D-alanine ligase [Oceanicella actignis]